MKITLTHIIIIIIILFVLYISTQNTPEQFTHEEIKRYPETLQINCEKSKAVLNNIREMNLKNCDLKGDTEKDTLNNRRICYDDIAKELVTQFDVNSNCAKEKRLINESEFMPGLDSKNNNGYSYIKM